MRPQGPALEVGQRYTVLWRQVECGCVLTLTLEEVNARSPWLAWYPVRRVDSLFSTEVDSAKYPNGETHWASVKMEVCACPEMVYGNLCQSEGDSTACSRRRQMSLQSWIQLAHLRKESSTHFKPDETLPSWRRLGPLRYSAWRG